MNKPLRNFSVTEYKPCYVVRRFLMILNLWTYTKGEYLPTMFIFLKRNNHLGNSKKLLFPKCQKGFQNCWQILELCSWRSTFLGKFHAYSLKFSEKLNSSTFFTISDFQNISGWQLLFHYLVLKAYYSKGNGHLPCSVWL